VPAQKLEQTRRQEEVVVPLSKRVTIMELRQAMCRWPLGDPATAQFRYCGAQAIMGLPYCHYHAQVAYQPAVERKRLRA
jgi:GcrA cell cycle regulator